MSDAKDTKKKKTLSLKLGAKPSISQSNSFEAGKTVVVAKKRLRKSINADKQTDKLDKSITTNEIKNLDDFAGLTTDDLLGYYEDRHDKNSKVQGILEEFNLTKDEGDQLILEARKIWLDKKKSC